MTEVQSEWVSEWVSQGRTGPSYREASLLKNYTVEEVMIKKQTKYSGCLNQVWIFCWNNLWPPRSILTSEAKTKNSNSYGLQIIVNISTILYKRCSLVKYETFSEVTFDLLSQIWYLRPNERFFSIFLWSNAYLFQN